MLTVSVRCPSCKALQLYNAPNFVAVEAETPAHAATCDECARPFLVGAIVLLPSEAAQAQAKETISASIVPADYRAILQRLAHGPVPLDALSRAEKIKARDGWKVGLVAIRGIITSTGGALEMNAEEFECSPLGHKTLALLAEAVK